MALNNDQIRKHGVSFSEAWYVFASPQLRVEFGLLNSGNSEASYDAIRGLKSFSQIALNYQKHHLGAAQKAKRHTELVREMKSNLVEWLFEEDLHAFAHQLKPRSIRSFRRIRDDFWENANYDWENNAARNLEFHFHKILIIDPDDLPELSIKPKIGRKSHKDKIEAVIRELDSKSDNFRNGLVHKSRNELIRKNVKQKYPELDVYGYGFGNDAIRKIANSYFKNNN